MLLRIDANEFRYALDSHDPETEHYYDRQTGVVVASTFAVISSEDPE